MITKKPQNKSYNDYTDEELFTNTATTNKSKKNTKKKPSLLKKLLDKLNIHKKPLSPEDNTQICLYVLYLREDPHTPIYIASTEDELINAVDHYLFLKHFDHYSLWLTLHDDKGASLSSPRLAYPSLDSASWNTYALKYIEESEINEDFKITKSYYSLNDLASIMRSFTKTIPLNLTSERGEEFKCYFLENGVSDIKDLDKLPKMVKLFYDHSDKYKEKVDNELKEIQDYIEKYK